jgi:hypothetical protein
MTFWRGLRKYWKPSTARQQAAVDVRIVHDSVGSLATPVALFPGSEFGAHLRRVFEDDLALAREVTLEQWQRHHTLRLRLREWLARSLDYDL